MGGRVYGPYTGRHFASRREMDIEHMVATSEAHDSELCAADAATKRRIASDLANLTLATPSVNRHQKSGKDAGEWLPRRNRCWFASQVIAVKRKYGLTVRCTRGPRLGGRAVGVRFDRDGRGGRGGVISRPTPGTTAPDAADVLRRWDTNGNGRITCKEARQHGIAPVRREHPAYRFMRDGDGDGVVCE